MGKKTGKKKRLSAFDKALMAISIVLICVSAGVIGYVSLMNWSPMAEPDVSGTGGGGMASIDEEIKTDEENKNRVTNFLVTGIDYAEGSGRGKLTDVIMVVQLNLETSKVDVLQIPRDTYVGTDVSSTGKINAVYGHSGIEGLAQVIYDRFQIPLDHYVNINMDGFINIVDAIGGVEIDVQESFTLEGVTFRPGLQTLNGEQAEKFVRERYHRKGSDVGRMNAQRQFLAAMFKKFKHLSLGEITSLAPVLMQEVTTDLKVGTVLSLAQVALGIDMSEISFYMVPGEGCYANNGQAVWTVHKQALADLLNEHFRPFSEDITAEELNLVEIQNTTDVYDQNNSTVDDLLGGGES